jgi:hypothetical protein
VEAFAPRPVEFHGLRGSDGWRLKVYSVRYGSRPLDWPAFDAGLRMADATLPHPATTDGRPGVGFLIAHEGQSADYVVLCWWDQENELPLKVFVHLHGPDESWRPARTRESFCVWDLDIIWSERQAYVDTMLNGGGGDVEAYLARVLARD